MVTIKISKNDEETDENSKENPIKSEENAKAAGIAFVHILIPVI